MSLTSLIKKYVNNLDIDVALLGLLMSFALLFVYFKISSTMMILLIGVALLIVSPAYLIFRLREKRKDKKYLDTGSEDKTSKSFFDTIKDSTPLCKPVVGRVGSIIYWLCVTFAMIALIAVPDTRSGFYFVFFALAAGGIALSILSARNGLQTVFTLIKIVFLGLVAKLSKICFFGAYGNDNIGHMIANEVIANTGNLDSMLGLKALTKEVSYPIMHINVAVSDIVTGLPIKDATTIGHQLPVAISFICVFLFATLFFGKRVGLFAALTAVIGDWLLTAYTGTTQFGCCIFFFIVFILGKCMVNKSSFIWNGLFVLFAILLVETHAVSSAVMLVTVIAFFMGKWIYNILYQNREFPVVDFGYCAIFILAIATRSIYSMFSEGSSLFKTVIGPFLDKVLTGSAGLSTRVDSLSQSQGLSEPAWSQFIDSLGFLILVSLCIFAMYVWLQKRNAKPVVWAVIVSFLLIQFVTYVFPFMGLRSIMPSRWFLFMYFFFAVMAGAAFVYLLYKNKKWRVAVPVIIVILAFCMASGSTANDDSPLFSSDYRESLVFTFEEAAAAKTLTDYSNWRVLTDFRYGYPMVLRMNAYYNTSILESFTEETVPDVYDRTIIWREYTLKRPITLNVNVGGKTLTKYSILGDEFRNGLSVRYNSVYDVGGARGYFG